MNRSSFSPFRSIYHYPVYTPPLSGAIPNQLNFPKLLHSITLHIKAIITNKILNSTMSLVIFLRFVCSPMSAKNIGANIMYPLISIFNSLCMWIFYPKTPSLGLLYILQSKQTQRTQSFWLISGQMSRPVQRPHQ